MTELIFEGELILMALHMILEILGQLLGLGIPMMNFCLKLEVTGSSLTRKNYLEIMEIHITMLDLPRLLLPQSNVILMKVKSYCQIILLKSAIDGTFSDYVKKQ